MEIRGRVSTALCYAAVIEDGAVEQIRRMCDSPFTEGSRIRIMPDVHAGRGCTIGTTMTVRDRVVPNIVGVDIGCGMYTVSLGKTDINLEQMDAAAHALPSGMAVWPGRRERFEALADLRCCRELRDTRRIERSLGSLGGGNHFIEIDQAMDGTRYLVIHSGSRSLGKQVAEHYQHLAVELNRGKGEYYARRDALIAEYKAQGQDGEGVAHHRPFIHLLICKHRGVLSRDGLHRLYGKALAHLSEDLTHISFPCHSGCVPDLAQDHL